MTTDNESRDPLLEAAAAGNVDQLRALAAAGADLDQAVDGQGNTAAEVAARAKHWDFVLAVGALGGDLGKHGLLSCLAWAVSSEPDRCQALLEGGCPHSEPDGSSQALRSAAESDNEAIVDLLLGAGASLDGPDAKGRTPLSSASRMGHSSMVAHLLAKGADPNGAGGENAPVLLAQKHNRVECLRALLDASPSLDVRDAKGLTGLERAKKAYQQDIVTLWEEALAGGADESLDVAHVPRAERPTEPFDSLDALLQHWGSVDAIDPRTTRVINGPWVAWVDRGLSQAFDCTLALELYGVDPDASWPIQLLQELALAAIEPVKGKRGGPDAPMPSLGSHLADRELELRFTLSSAPAALFSEQDWGRALVDLRPDAFGGSFDDAEGARKTVFAMLPLTIGEWVFRQEGSSLAEIRGVHEALDRDVLASPHWRNGWHAEAGGSLADWLSRQGMIRERVHVVDGSRRAPKPS